MRILFLGDIVGRPGRRAVRERLPSLRRKLGLDLVLANAENASGGLGLTPQNARELREAGVDLMTSGNHIWKYREIYPFLREKDWLLRPANYPPEVPGRGSAMRDLEGCRVGVLNLQGRVFMEPLDCPFRTADSLLRELPKRDPGIILVDVHAEATAEKQALAHYLQGRVTAVLGTHTHVQTRDASVGSGGTGYITDLGMCGPPSSVIGMAPEAVLEGFLSQLPQRFSVAGGQAMLQGALLEADPGTGKTVAISAWSEKDGD